MGLTAHALLIASMALGQDVASIDHRLSDPAFIKVRDEALDAAKCADRTKPVTLSTPTAQYPDALVKDRGQGTAITEGIILIDGSVKYTRVVRADNPDLGNAALEVLKNRRYKAATCSGKPVPAIVTMTHTFSTH